MRTGKPDSCYLIISETVHSTASCSFEVSTQSCGYKAFVGPVSCIGSVMELPVHPRGLYECFPCSPRERTSGCLIKTLLPDSIPTVSSLFSVPGKDWFLTPWSFWIWNNEFFYTGSTKFKNEMFAYAVRLMKTGSICGGCDCVST